MNTALEKVEKSLQDYLGNADEHVEVIKATGLTNTYADSVEVLREHNEFMPSDITGKDEQVYGIRDICVMFPEISSIHADGPDPIRTVRYPGIAMVQTDAESDEVAFFDCRPDASDKKKICDNCTKAFCRWVLDSEHDETNLYFCPVTNVGCTEKKFRSKMQGLSSNNQKWP